VIENQINYYNTASYHSRVGNQLGDLSFQDYVYLNRDGTKQGNEDEI